MIGGRDEGGSVGLLSLGAWAIGAMAHGVDPTQAAFDAVLIDRREGLGLVQRTDRNRYLIAITISEGQWCAALSAKAALGLIGRVEDGNLAAGDGEAIERSTDERCIEAAKGFLAHAAVADMGAVRLLIETIAHSAALATAGK